MTNLFEGNAQAARVARELTVYSEQLPNDNRKFTTRYYGLSREAVESAANAAVKKIDFMRSPSASRVYNHGEYFAVNVTYYSLD